MKACPVDDVLAGAGGPGAGFDAASPNEIAQALRTGVPADRVHYGNTVKSDRDIAEAYRLGIRDFATDSLEDVAAIAAHAPGTRVFCRLATTGSGALWGLTGSSAARRRRGAGAGEPPARHGLTPAGLSLHVGSQQMTEAWRDAFDAAGRRCSRLGSGASASTTSISAAGCPRWATWTATARRCDPPLDKIFAAIRDGHANGCGNSPRRPRTSSWSRAATWSPTTARSGRTYPADRAAARTGSGSTGST